MLHRLRHHSQLTALIVLGALLLCVLSGCLQHKLSLTNSMTHLSQEPAHSLQADMPDCHTAHAIQSLSATTAEQPPACHSTTDCGLERAQPSHTPSWADEAHLLALFLLLPLIIFSIQTGFTLPLIQLKRPGRVPITSYPQPYLTLLVLRN